MFDKFKERISILLWLLTIAIFCACSNQFNQPSPDWLPFDHLNPPKELFGMAWELDTMNQEIADMDDYVRQPKIKVTDAGEWVLYDGCVTT